MKFKSVTLYGVFPPNIGGVSSHISRLFYILKDNGVDVRVLINNYNRVTSNYPQNTIDVSLKRVRSLLGRLKRLEFFKKNYDIYHLHGSLLWDYIYVFYLAVVRKRNVVFTVHDAMQIRSAIIFRHLLSVMYLLIPKNNLCFIAVSDLIKKQLISLKIPENRIEVIPAFIPMPISNPHLPLIEYSGYPIILGYAPGYFNDADENIYGIKLTIETFKLILNGFENAHLVLCFPNGIAEDRIKLILEETKLPKETYTIISTPINNMSDLLVDIDMYIRLTSTDGDSNLVREALANGCFVVASDVVNRPENCIICNSQDIKNVADVALQALSIKKNKSYNINNINSLDTIKMIINVYETKF